jgi:hypothetical protein
MIKNIAAILLLVTSVQLSAQTKAWAPLKGCKDVIDRIYSTAPQSDYQTAAKGWSEILVQQANQLTGKNVPADYNNAKAKAAIGALQQKSKALHEKAVAQASNDEIKKALDEVKAAHEAVVKSAGKS